MSKVTRREAIRLIDATKGKIFTVTFKNKAGKTRSINGRMGVKTGVKGVGANYDAPSLGMRRIYDLQAKRYKTIDLRRVSSLKAGGQLVIVG